MFQMRLRGTSPFVGKPPQAVAFTDYPGLQLVAIQDGALGGPLRRAALVEGDYLLLRGSAETAAAFAARNHLASRRR